MECGSLSLVRVCACHMGSHSVTCHVAAVKIPPLPQPVEAGTPLSESRVGVQGELT